MREFRQEGRKHVLVWRVEVDGDTVRTWHGVLDGKLQSTADRKYPRNIGRSNEKPATLVAREDAERLILNKVRGGYIEYIDGHPQKPLQDEGIDLGALPQGLSFYKPYNTLQVRMEKKLNAGDAWALRKRNGDAMIIAKSSGNVRMYSRRMIDHAACESEDWPYTERFPHIAEEFAWAMPDNTVLLGELVAGEVEDNRRRVNALVKSKTERALELQEDEGWAYYYVWDIAFLEGADVVRSWTHGRRILQAAQLARNCDYLLPPDVYELADFELPRKTTFREYLQDLAVELDWEGWVVIDPMAVIGERGWNLRGKTDRDGKASCKLKPFFEDDVVVYWNPKEGIGSYGTGRFQGQVKSLAMYQYDLDGELMHVGNVSSGLTDSDKRRLANPDLYPMVLHVNYLERFYKKDGDGSNKMINPSVGEQRFRDDKEPRECVNDRL